MDNEMSGELSWRFSGKAVSFLVKVVFPTGIVFSPFIAFLLIFSKNMITGAEAAILQPRDDKFEGKKSARYSHKTEIIN